MEVKTSEDLIATENGNSNAFDNEIIIKNLVDDFESDGTRGTDVIAENSLGRSKSSQQVLGEMAVINDGYEEMLSEKLSFNGVGDGNVGNDGISLGNLRNSEIEIVDDRNDNQTPAPECTMQKLVNILRKCGNWFCGFSQLTVEQKNQNEVRTIIPVEKTLKT